MFRPPRLNTAGVCMWCGDFRCTSAECVARYAVSWWGPCNSCWAGAEEYPGDCLCSFGIEELAGPEHVVERALEFFAFLGIPAVVVRDELLAVAA